MTSYTSSSLLLVTVMELAECLSFALDQRITLVQRGGTGNWTQAEVQSRASSIRRCSRDNNRRLLGLDES